MSELITRRNAVLGLATAGGIVALTCVQNEANAAADKPHLAMNDPTAMALAYFEDAKKVDPKKFPTYKAGQLCSNCLQNTGKDGEAWRPCNLFPGKLVNANGWCKVYVARPAAK
jgi:hypothetical protein